MIYLKSPSEIAIIKRNGAMLKSCFETVAEIIKAGVQKKEIDQAVEKVIYRVGCPHVGPVLVAKQVNTILGYTDDVAFFPE